MKRVLMVLLLALVGAMVTGCSGEPPFTVSAKKRYEPNLINPGDVYQVTVTATSEDPYVLEKIEINSGSCSGKQGMRIGGEISYGATRFSEWLADIEAKQYEFKRGGFTRSPWLTTCDLESITVYTDEGSWDISLTFND